MCTPGHRNSSLLVSTAVLLLATPLHTQQQFIDVLAKGSEWTLQVNGETATLRLLGGRGGRTADGGFELEYQVVWGDVDGALHAVSDASQDVRRVTLDLTYASGAHLQCQGFLARGSDDMMAGTCGGRDAPGAWYAVRVGADRTATPAENATDATELRRKLEQAAEEHAAATRRTELLQSRLSEVRADLQAESNALRQCRRQSESGSSRGIEPPPVNSFKNSLTGEYQRRGKFDNVTRLDFPDAPGAGSKLAEWLAAHNGALLSVLSSLYPQSEIAQFRAAERSTCQGKGVYCELAFRQQALAAALSGAR